ncbi:9496_t:CDS:2, partial [Acaulospora colombiana]
STATRLLVSSFSTIFVTNLYKEQIKCLRKTSGDGVTSAKVFGTLVILVVKIIGAGAKNVSHSLTTALAHLAPVLRETNTITLVAVITRFLPFPSQDSKQTGTGAIAAKDSSIPRPSSAPRATITILPVVGIIPCIIMLRGVKIIGAGATSARLSATRGTLIKAAGQKGWKWCRKCQAMCWSQPSDGDMGDCSAGGKHDHTGSGEYAAPVGTGTDHRFG